MNRQRRRVNPKNCLNLPVRPSTKAPRPLPSLFAGSRWLIQRGALLLLVFLSGCVSLEKSYPDRRYFALELAPGKTPNSTSDRILSVASLRISPRYADRSFVYRTSTAAYEADFYNQFLTAPDSMIAEELRKGLAASELFKYVVGPSNSLQPNYVLEGSINALYGDFRDPKQAAGVLSIRFVFFDAPNETPGSVLFQKNYSRRIPFKTRTAAALMTAWNEALTQILTDLTADLKKRNL